MHRNILMHRIDPTQVLTPAQEEVFWPCVLFFCLGMLVTMFVMMRHRRSCSLCGKWHPPRPANMTAVEYIQFFCDGIRRGYHVNNAEVNKLGWVSRFRKRYIPYDDAE